MSQKTPKYIQKISDKLHFKISHYVMPLPPPRGPQKFRQKSPSCSFLLITSLFMCGIYIRTTINDFRRPYSCPKPVNFMNTD